MGKQKIIPKKKIIVLSDRVMADAYAAQRVLPATEEFSSNAAHPSTMLVFRHSDISFAKALPSPLMSPVVPLSLPEIILLSSLIQSSTVILLSQRRSYSAVSVDARALLPYMVSPWFLS